MAIGRRGAALAVGAMAVAIAAAAPAAASGGGGCGGPITNERGTTVSIEQYCFTPTVLYVDTGDTVTFDNVDPVSHTVSGANGAWGSFEQLRRNRAVSYKFSSPGVYAYACILHPGMVGAVVVGDPPRDGTVDTNAVRHIKAVKVSAKEPASPTGTGTAEASPLRLGVVILLAAGAMMIGRRRRRARS